MVSYDQMLGIVFFEQHHIAVVFADVLYLSQCFTI